MTAPFAAGSRRRRADAPLAALARIAQAILDGRDADAVFDTIAREALEIVDAMGVVIGMPTHDGMGVRLRAAAGTLSANLGPVGIVRGSVVPIGDTIVGHAIVGRRAIVSRDLSHEPGDLGSGARRTGIGPVVAIPLAIRDGILGGLAVARPTGSPPFSRADIQVVRTFAAQASVALELSQVRDELRQLAVVQERERIAREMHDGVIQSLFGLGMSLEALATGATLPAGVGERLNLVVDGIDAAIRDLRNYIFGLRPGLLADRELESALRRLADEFRSTGGLTIEVDINPLTAALVSSRAADVVQVTREALSNVRKHARASRVRVNLTHADSRVLLEVADDGVGVDDSAGGGLGLDNMRARGKKLGGELLVGPGLEGRGTSVRFSIPL